MSALLGSLMGFATSAVPAIIGAVQDRADKRHELAMVAAQTDAQVKLQGIKLQAAHVDADVRQGEALLKHDSQITRKADQWVINLAASVRPIISYLFFLEFFLLTIAVNLGWLDLGQYRAIWDDEMQVIFAAIVSFWFGSRTMARHKHNT